MAVGVAVGGKVGVGEGRAPGPGQGVGVTMTGVGNALKAVSPDLARESVAVTT